jgi:dihydrofolate synthase/folylpolyglutamate synthase
VSEAGLSLDAWLQTQQTVHSSGIDLTLDRVRAVAQQMGLLPPRYRVITVAGTNGKGSTVEYLTALLHAGGQRVGTFTSPHLIRYNERIRIDRQMVSDERLIAAFQHIEAARGQITLTFFEFNLLAALWVFQTAAVDVAVLEVGLGGRLDAVNIIDADAAIICSIGFDHRDWLGDTLAAIGREKAGVLRAGRPAILADPHMDPSVEQQALQIGAQVSLAGRDYRALPGAAGDGSWDLQGPGLALTGLPQPSLAGAVQVANAAAALVTLAALQPSLLPGAAQIAAALTSVSLPGRFQVLPGPVEWILDVAHNEPAARVLADNLRARPLAGRTYLVTGILGDKDIAAIAQVLSAVTDRWILCGIAEPRGLTAAQLADRSPHFAGAEQVADIAAGVRLARQLAAPGDRVVVCGSFLAVAPAMAALGL